MDAYESAKSVFNDVLGDTHFKRKETVPFSWKHIGV